MAYQVPAVVHAFLFFFCLRPRQSVDRLLWSTPTCAEICPGLNANEIHIPYDKLYKLFSLVKSHQTKTRTILSNVK